MKRWSIVGLSAVAGLTLACHDSTTPLTEAQRAISPNLGNLDVGRFRVLTYEHVKDGLVIPKGKTGGEYAVVLTNVNPIGDGLTTFAMSTQRIGDDGQLAELPTGPDSAVGGGGSVSGTPAPFSSRFKVAQVQQRYRHTIESKYRGMARRALMPLMRRMYEIRTQQVRANVRTGIRRSFSASVPNVGDTLTVNTPTGYCSVVNQTRAVVKAVSTRAIVLSDVTSPAGGFSNSDFAAFAQEFDNVTYSTVTDNFGTPSDFDGNGLVYIYFTPFVNSLSPVDPTQGYVAGLFYTLDLAPASACPASNDGEIFYVMTPDPLGTVTQPFAAEAVREGVRGTLAHEFVHMIGAGRRVSFPQFSGFESSWLDEGMAHSSEQIVGRKVLGKTLDELITADQLQAMDDPTWRAYFEGDIVNALYYLQDPSTLGPISSEFTSQTSIPARGASWALLQFAGDHFVGGNRRNFFRSLIATTDTGVTNLVNRIGVPLDTLLTHWHTAIRGNPVAQMPELRYKSYQWYDIFTQFGFYGHSGYPVPVREIPSTKNNTIIANVFGSGASYFTVKQSPTVAQRIRFGIDTTLSPASSLRIAIVRTK